ncbi:hypothetical protein [Marinicellulosiphila megalodicopiae]|uniref:hypothetical protein n=1 Tax=Marinicellulosiphila megalodicopiae TaxID=2724896 RepID=UPI003BAF8FAB
MKKVVWLVGLYAVITIVHAGKKLTENEIYDLKNPYKAELKYKRFEYCKNGLIPFRSIATTPKADLDSSVGFYEFDAEDLKYAQTRVIQLAVTQGKKYNGKKIDKVIGNFWNECLELPLEFFKDDQVESDALEYEELESLL